MKKFVKLLALTLCAMLFVSSVACSGGGGDDEGNEPYKREPIDLTGITTHIDKSTETENYVVENGLSDYKIILPQQMSNDYEGKAADYVKKYFAEATGVTLTTTKAGSYTASAKFISIGDTVVAEGAGVSFEYADETKAGFQIKTVGQSIFILGVKSSRGLKYGAMELMTRMFNLDYFDVNDYYIDKEVKNLKLMNYDIVEIPDVEYVDKMVSGELHHSNDPYYNDFLRVVNSPYTGKTNGVHNTSYYLPYDQYKGAHPGWFGVDGDGKPLTETENGQIVSSALCYTNLIKDIDVVKPILMKQFIEVGKGSSFSAAVSFNNRDTHAWCCCPGCTASKEKYGCESAVYVQFLNLLADDFHEEMLKKENGSKDMKLLGMAYLVTEDAPVDKDYQPIDDSVKCSKNLTIMLCPHGTMKWYYEMDNPQNKVDYDKLKAWGNLAETLYMFGYNQLSYKDYLMFYDDFDSMQRNIQIFVKAGTEWYLSLGQYDSTGKSTAFNRLRAYLVGKLSWNCQLNQDELVKKYFDGHFGPASEAMHAIYDAQRAKYKENYDLYASIFPGKAISSSVLDGQFIVNATDATEKKWFYDNAFLTEMLKKIDEAYTAIASLETTDNAKYVKLHDSIELESVCFSYLKIRNFAKQYGSKIFDAKDSFGAVIRKYNIEGAEHDGGYTKLLSSLGIA